MRRFFPLALAGTASAAVILLLFQSSGCSSKQDRVVVYSAQDPEFADLVFEDYRHTTGVVVAPRYDTEANKSVSLYEELVREASRPRCDVHWNNEILSTIRLQRQGLLEPYASPSARPYPAWCKGPEDSWHAFAARARVLIVNTKMVAASDFPKSILDLTEPRWKGKVGMAKPQFGTTATHAACLFEVLGSEAGREFFQGLKANGVQIVPGNKQVAEGVSAGQFAVGITDTDDAMIEVTAGRPVTLLFPDRDGHAKYPRLGTLFIPNTVAVIRGAPNAAGARKLVDFLLSAEVEKRLSESESRQIPLNPEVKVELAKPMERPKEAGGRVKSMEVDFNKAADLWNEVQAFLQKDFVQP